MLTCPYHEGKEIELSKSLHTTLKHCNQKVMAFTPDFLGDSQTPIFLTFRPVRVQNVMAKKWHLEWVHFIREESQDQRVALFGLETLYPLIWIPGNVCFSFYSNPKVQLPHQGPRSCSHLREGTQTHLGTWIGRFLIQSEEKTSTFGALEVFWPPWKMGLWL